MLDTRLQIGHMMPKHVPPCEAMASHQPPARQNSLRLLCHSHAWRAVAAFNDSISIEASVPEVPVAEPRPVTSERIKGKQTVEILPKNSCPTRRLRGKSNCMTVEWCRSVCSMQPSEVLGEAQEASASVPPEQDEQEGRSGSDHVSRKRSFPEQVEDSNQKRHRGRPLGSKNKRCLEPSEDPAGDEEYPVKASRSGKNNCISIFSKIKLFEELGAGFGTRYCPKQCSANFWIVTFLLFWWKKSTS